MYEGLKTRPQESVFVRQRRFFFSSSSYRAHVSGKNGHRKRIFLKTFSRVKIFENALFSFIRTDENNSNTLSVDSMIFENGGKNLCF